MYQSLSYFLLFLFTPFVTHAGVLNWFSFGMSTGYRFNNSSIYLEHYGKRFIYTGEYIQNNSQGLGYSLGVSYKFKIGDMPLEIDPCCYFTRLAGGFSAHEWHDQNLTKHTVFNVADANYIIPSVAVRCNIAALEKREHFIRKGRLSVFCRVGYRCYVLPPSSVQFVRGDPYPDRQKKLERDQKEGLGISFGLCLFIGRKEKK